MTNKTVYKLFWTGNPRGRWMITKDDGSREYAVGRKKTKSDAKSKAKRKARKDKPSVLRIYTRDKKLQKKIEYD